MKATYESLALPSQPADATVFDLKNQYAVKSGLDVTKIKMLLNKRPCSDLKTLKELLPEPAPTEVEFTLMIMPGASSPATPSTPAAASPAIELPDPTASAVPVSASTDPAPLSERAEARPESTPHAADTAKEMLSSDDFWADLKSFLVQRLKSEAEGERLLDVFAKAARP